LKRAVIGLAALGACAVTASAQIPDVIIKIDPLLHYREVPRGKDTLRGYDSLGNYGTVGLSFNLEPGFQVVVSQRLQKIKGNADGDQLDLLYIEDRGLWRVGKQILPFGRNQLLRESVYAARFETTLGSEAFPAVFAACDAGPGRQSGFTGRIGTRFGASFAIGEHFGIDASSFTSIRFPEESPGRGRGYNQIIGVDFAQNVGSLKFRAEHVWLQVGQTPQDENNEVTDVLILYEPDLRRSFAFGWARKWKRGEHEFRLLGKVPMGANVWLEPIVLVRGDKLRATGVSLRVKF
jgi:hypothetical protein